MSTLLENITCIKQKQATFSRSRRTPCTTALVNNWLWKLIVPLKKCKSKISQKIRLWCSYSNLIHSKCTNTYGATVLLFNWKSDVVMLLTGIQSTDTKAACRNAVHWFTKYWNKLHVEMLVSGHWLKSNETSSVMQPHSNLCWPPGGIAVWFHQLLLFKPLTTWSASIHAACLGISEQHSYMLLGYTEQLRRTPSKPATFVEMTDGSLRDAHSDGDCY